MISPGVTRYLCSAVAAGALLTTPAAGAKATPTPTVKPTAATSAADPDLWDGGPGDVLRIAGSNRYGTSEAAAKRWAGPIGTAYVVSGRNYPDALVAAARAGSQDAPVLLTQPDSVPTETLRALKRLRPYRIVVIGGTAAVSASVESSLRSQTRGGLLKRVSGKDRYETGAKLARSYSKDVRRVYLATGEDFPDALAAAALAGSEKAPLLLTKASALGPKTAAQLDRLSPQEVIVVGNTNAVSSTTAKEAASYSSTATATRVAGGDPAETSAKVAGRFDDTGGTVFIANSENYADALVGAALAARRNRPILLTPGEGLGSSTIDALSAAKPDAIRIMGGSSAMSDTVVTTVDGVGCQNDMPTKTILGASLNQVETGVAKAMNNIDSTFGRVPLVRHFSPSLPKHWDSRGKRALQGRTVITSFKAPPQDVVDGEHDEAIRDFFELAPPAQTIYWSYFHEPEAEIENKKFSSSDYKAAWRRIAGIADTVCRPDMYSTLILTGWTGNPDSGRSISTYDAGKEYVDLLSYDPYNGIGDPDRAYYADPEDMYGHLVELAERDGRPFAIAETGSRLIEGDDGTRRAQWLKDITAYLVESDSVFVSYFNSVNGFHWRLDDRRSQQAWAQLISKHAPR